MKTKTIELPVIPKWLYERILVYRNDLTFKNNAVAALNTILYFIEDGYRPWIEKHIDEVLTAIMYGYEVEDE